MSLADIWAEAIGAERDVDGQPLLGTVLAHIRGAVIETGYISRGRITSGLKEAYRPLGVDEKKLRDTIDEALQVLLLSGDFDEFTTGAGRGYAVKLQVQVRRDLIAAARIIPSVIVLTATPALHLAATRRELMALMAGMVRTRLLLIPTKTAPRIVTLKRPAEAQALLRKEINAALAAIAATPAI